MTANTESTGRKPIDKAVFKFFEKFINQDEAIRVRGAAELLAFLANDDKEKERSYALKRLVRGVGSNNNDSRAGYFTALVGYLQQVKGTEASPSVTELFNLMKSELSDSDKDEGEDRKQVKLELRVGKVSVCGAIIISGLIEEGATEDELQMVVKALKKGMHKQVTPLAMSYLSELVQRVETKKFGKVMWPVLEPVLNVSKEEHTMDTIYFLLATTTKHRKAVNQQYFETNFGCSSLLHQENFGFIAKLLWEIQNTLTINHPLYDFVIEVLVNQGKIAAFWDTGVEPILLEDEDTELKYKDIVTLRVLITILGKLDNYSSIPALLSPGLLQMVIKNTKNFAQLSEDVRELYQEAFTALSVCFDKVEEDSKLVIFEKLVNSPSSILIEKHAPNKLIQNLLSTMNAESVKAVAEILKKLILSQDNEKVLNSERVHAAQTLQKLLTNRHIQTDSEWRMDTVKFYLNLGLFYSSDGRKVLKSVKNQESVISSDIVPIMKSIFFHCLEQKHSKLSDEKDFLLVLVEYIQAIFQKSGTKSLRAPLSDIHMEHWTRMFNSITKKEKQSNKLSNVFQILMMYMGLHLFSEAEVAASSIAELESVMKRIQGKKKSKPCGKMEINQNGTNAEPQWIEVVVDLFLNLMSQNSHLLRKVIGHVFPHLSEEMTLTAFNQILSVVNLKDKTNPLSVEDSGSVDGEDKMETDEEADSEDDDTSGVGSQSDIENFSGSEDVDEDEDEDSGSDDDEENEKVTDKMRMAIQAALGGAHPETDTESVDLDNMKEEDGQKLDAALAAAFKMFKESKKSKPTKEDVKVDTTLTHFRMRVFDLIDIYLKNSPNMIVCLELMLYIFEMLPVAIKETKYKQILERYRCIFNNLIKVKQTNVDVKDVSSEQLVQILKDLMEKVAKGPSFPDKNQYLLKACQFIVICAQLIEKNDENNSDTSIAEVFCEYLKVFIADRNPPLSLNVFSMLFKLNWAANWRLAKVLAENGLNVQVRIIRRAQTLQLLKDLLRNKRLINSSLPQTLKTVKHIGNQISPYMEGLAAADTVAQNEFSELVQLLLELNAVQRQQKDFTVLNWKQAGSLVQKLRRVNLNSQTMCHYLRLCKFLQLEPIKNDNEKKNQNTSSKSKQSKQQNSLTNGQHHSEDENDDDDNVEQAKNCNGKMKRKKKNNAGDTAKQKRLRKEERLRAASQGLETVSFVNAE
ncbi:myb-binding protein 1A [Uranotaenia lowii]|uniref:myb-binding protein 1A n=1 Tax=Uranotaenia lowii TaxID=190385 RepID=UPI0024791C59|nr:myb-binding protein 1A [Uranotaenia lowii]